MIEKYAPGLGQGLYDQHSGHQLESRKMSSKERFVVGNVLQSQDTFARLQFKDSINQEKRVPVR